MRASVLSCGLFAFIMAIPPSALGADVSCPAMLTTASARFANPTEFTGWRPVFEADNAHPVLALDVTLLTGEGAAREEIVASERTEQRLVWLVKPNAASLRVGCHYAAGLVFTFPIAKKAARCEAVTQRDPVDNTLSLAEVTCK